MGEPRDPLRHRARLIVKPATYHQLKIERPQRFGGRSVPGYLTMRTYEPLESRISAEGSRIVAEAHPCAGRRNDSRGVIDSWMTCGSLSSRS